MYIPIYKYIYIYISLSFSLSSRDGKDIKPILRHHLKKTWALLRAAIKDFCDIPNRNGINSSRALSLARSRAITILGIGLIEPPDRPIDHGVPRWERKR